MPYCPECGEEIKEDAIYCPKCGTQIREDETGRRPRETRRADIGVILAYVFGGLIILASFGVLVAGGGIFWVQRSFGNEKGFLTMGEIRFETDSYALALQRARIDMDADMPGYNFRPEDIATIRITGESNTGKPVFIGIAREDMAEDYLENVAYNEVSRFDWTWDPFTSSTPDIRYIPHNGGQPDSPQGEDWVTSTSGTGEEILEWTPQTGTFWLIVMNADASSDVDVDLSLGVKAPFLNTLAVGLIAGGVIGMLVGIVILYFGAIRRTR
jgi:hypothetical protein